MPPAMRSITFLFVVCASVMAAASRAQMGEGLSDPVVKGAWLYKANCIRCHGDYGKERPGESFDSEERLASAIGEKGCRIVWANNLGGSLSGEEIAALCQYILVWERGGKEPELPDLPKIAKTKVAGPPSPKQSDGFTARVKTENQALSPPLAKLVATHPVAQGGWLYTQNCYRCHLTYGHTRQGRGLSGESLRKIVENGKTSTQMTGFAVLAGGKLRDSEIEALLSYIVAWESLAGPPAIAKELLNPPATDPAGLRPLGLPRFSWVDGDETLGRNLYFTHCSRCHNPDRSGYIGRRLLPSWNTLRPDLFLKASVKGGIPGSLMPAFSTNANVKLTPKEIDDIVAFLLVISPHS